MTVNESQSDRRKLVVIDGNSLVYRAFFAMRHLSTSEGQPTNAVYGFTMMLLHILEVEKPDVLAVAFDSPVKTFRHTDYDGYKAHRKPTPDDLRSQMPIVRELIQAFGIPVIISEGFEADDIVGTVAKQASEEGYETIIVTGDLDALQLVTNGVRVMTTIKGVTDTVLYDRQAVIEKLGVEPDQVADFKALKGDPSDNIPGVAGIGDKGAIKLLQQFGHVEDLLEHIDELADEKLRDKIISGSGQMIMSKRLATIVTDAPMDVSVSEMTAPSPDNEKLAEIFQKLEFKSMLRRLPERPEAPRPRTEADLGSYRVVESEGDLRKMLECFSAMKAIAIRLHTSNRRIMDSTIVGLALSAGTGETSYVRIAEGSAAGSGSLDLGFRAYHAPLAAFKDLLESPTVAKYGHDLKNDYGVLKRHGVNLQGISFDALIGAYVLNPGRSKYDVFDVAFEQLGLEIPQIDKKNKNGVDEAEAIRVICAETESIFRVVPVLMEGLETNGLVDLMSIVEAPLIPILADMEIRGVAIDTQWLGQLSSELDVRIRALEQEIYELAGLEFNIGSTKQLQSVLFDKLQLPSGKKTKTGLSTGAETLEALAPLYPIVSKILEYRELAKLKSTYADALPRLINPTTGRIHTSLNQAVTATGRLSSSEPNLQNIPIRTEIGREIRKAFIGSNGNLLISADYSQIELRILAHVTRDTELVRAFRADEDVHVHTACALFNVGPEDVTPEMRRRAKTINFAVIYGMSDFGLANELGIPPRLAKTYIEEYFAKFPGVRRYTDETLEMARQKGFVSTLLGRRRYIPEIYSPNRNYRMFGERAAVNMPIQGTAADIMKLAMIEMESRLNKMGARTEMVLQVHDELVFEVPPDELDRVAPVIRSAMENAAPLDVDLKVDVKVGRNWCEMGSLGSGEADS
ncbi:MAG: DNA polymerase I [Armatimonadota bacterium]|nr:DNA polymerase I [Armatimonadota bacterium]